MHRIMIITFSYDADMMWSVNANTTQRAYFIFTGSVSEDRVDENEEGQGMMSQQGSTARSY